MARWHAAHWCCVFCLHLLEVVNGWLPPTVKIGAIFTDDQRDSAVEMAFKYAVLRVNRDSKILPNTTLKHYIEYAPRDNSFHASKQACLLVEKGVYAIFGPSDPLLGAHVQSICDALDIPHVETRLDVERHAKEFSINLHPHQPVMNAALRDVMTFLNWTRVAIIYEEENGLIKLQDLIRTPPNMEIEIAIRQGTPDTFRHVLKEVKSREIFNLIVDTRAESMPTFLRAILQLQMNDYKYHYLFTTFDIETFDLEDFKYNFVNMTAFRLVSDSFHVREILRQMEQFQPVGHSIISKSGVIEAQPALMFDSVLVFARALTALQGGAPLEYSSVSCGREQPWPDGSSLFNYINAVRELRGLTGPIQFSEGKRTTFKLDLLKLKQHALVKVGEWTPAGHVNITDYEAFYDPGTLNVTLVVTTNLDTPYVMMRPGKNYTGNARFYGFCIDLLELIADMAGFSYIMEVVPDRRYGARDPETGEWDGMVHELVKGDRPYVMLRQGTNLTGNDRFEGFCIDLLRSVANFVGFNYTIMLNPDGIYGLPDPETGEWNGLVRQLIDKKADLAVGSMSINYARESVIDFTKPFMNLGITILFKVSKESKLFVFLSPLESRVWLYAGAAFLAVSLLLYLVARLSPYERVRLQRRRPPVNQFGLSNTMWFVTGTLLRQGSGVFPQVPTSQETRLFSFMNPLAVHIWLYVLAAYLLVSLTMFVVARVSPYEWQNPHPCTAEDDVMENQFSISNSFWFTIGTLMQQGSDLNPKAISTRIVGGIWWFFTLIIISSYTANLAAFLTVERMITPIESAEDLADQSDISYGTLEGGSTLTFFRDSKIDTYKKMWRFMENKKPSVFTKTIEEGISRVLQGNYAYLAESTTIDYIVNRNCNLTQIGGLLDSKGFGIATTMGSPWRDPISLAILELQEKAVIHTLYNKWWKDNVGSCNRDDKNKESKASELGVANIGGVFVVLLCGLAFAVCVAIVEFCWTAKRNAQLDKQSLCSEMVEELCFAMRCHASDQRPALTRHCDRCMTPATAGIPRGAHDPPPLNGSQQMAGGEPHYAVAGRYCFTPCRDSEDNGVMKMMELSRRSPLPEYES
ncbi:glutamate receptor ionotropic, kainate 2-like isoform X3 [Pollicipes pollicipes]|uniref:glutamate receptor ionotropic, kainate 2-like isoform X3 n=1 Tax=Pollicipes pollicipes TaxID=41117 RepID=UPI001884C424|nr:glutamate receptor ionotropic, kainate 2-like isoform X3 [Pollicipes pollicipes]